MNDINGGCFKPTAALAGKKRGEGERRVNKVGGGNRLKANKKNSLSTHGLIQKEGGTTPEMYFEISL